MDSKRTRTLIGLALALITVAAYSRVVDFDFINFDDPDYVTNNNVVNAGLTWHGIAWAFTHFYASNWHPLTWISHMLDCQIFGTWAGGHHLVNVLFHSTNSIILFFLLFRLTGAQWRSAIVAALFAWHPIHVESVAWISERKDVLSTFFGLLSLSAYVGKQKGRWQSGNLWALFFFALGLLAKPMLVTLPLLMLLLDFWPLQRVTNEGWRTLFRPGFWKLVLDKWPWFTLTFGSCAATLYAQKTGGAVMGTYAFPLFWRIVNALESYFWYAKKLLWPVNLAAYYPLEHVKSIGLFVGESTVLIVVTMVAVLALKKRPYLLMGWLWFLISLVPVIGLVQVGSQGEADRYDYIPSIGIFIALIWGIGELLGDRKSVVVLESVASCAVLGLCIHGTMAQVNTWKNGFTLFGHAIMVTRDNFAAYDSLGMTWFGFGENAKALEALNMALKINPEVAEVQRDKGVVLVKMRRREEAIKWLDSASQLNPNDADTQNLLGAQLAALGKNDEALKHHARAVQLKPQNAEFQNNFGAALAAMGNRADAELHYAEAVRLEPGNAHYQNNYGTALARANQPQQAIEHFLAALRLNPRYGDAYSNLGAVYFAQGHLEDAVRSFENAISANPGNADAYNNLGNALTSLGKMEQAVAQYSRALKLNPTNATIYINLGKALSKSGQAEEAMAEFTEAVRLQPDNASAQFDAGIASLQLRREETGLVYLREAARLRPNWPSPLNAAAWTLATSPDDRMRNGAEAVRLAEAAAGLTSRQQPAILNTLAAAYAEAGRFEEAASTANEALKLAQRTEQTNLAVQIEEARVSYQAGRPYRQKPEVKPN